MKNWINRVRVLIREWCWSCIFLLIYCD